MERSINFSQNWNDKLSKRIFTTIRKYTKEKGNYYLEAVEGKFTINLQGSPYCTAKLVQYEQTRLKDLPVAMVCEDTGLIFSQALAVFKRFGITQETEIIVLTFQRSFP